MANINFGILDTQLPGRIAAIPQEAQKQQTANMLQAMQVQGAMRQNEMSQMQLDELKSDRAEMVKLQQAMQAKGGSPDLGQYADMLMRSPKHMQLGIQLKQKIDAQAKFAEAMREEAPIATPGPTNALAPSAAPPANALAAPADPTATMRRTRNRLLGIDTDQARAAVKSLDEDIKAARAITTVAPGTTALRDGAPLYTAPTAFEKMLADSNLTPEAKVAARKALISKETNIAQPEFVDTLRALGTATDPATRTFLTNRLNYLTTHAPGTNVKVNAYIPASEEAQKEFMKETRATYGALKQSSAMFANIEAAKKLIPSASAFMGAGGEGMKTAASFLNNRLGMNINTEGVKDATELQSRLFQGIMDNLRKLDAQPSERQQAALQEALGSLATDPKALSNVLDAFADSVRNKIDIHNAEVQSAISRGVKFPYDPIIKTPAKSAGPDVYVRGSDGVIRKQ